MRRVLRLVDRTLALSLAFAPLGQLLAGSSVGTSGAVLAGGVLSLLVAALLDFFAVSVLARYGGSLVLRDSPLLGPLA
ncbi:hypothetical protein HALDL1_06425 [Halobacterium sp. DL1]|nr:hypothetical protein HALDL1_06425 [Halobacterium sp. DL1]